MKKKKKSKEFRKGFLKAVSLLRSIDRKSYDWHLKHFGDDGAGPDDYAKWIKGRLSK